MNAQAVKLELIKKIADIQSEQLLEQLWEFLNREEKEGGKRKKVSSLSEREADLLLKINEGLPEPIQWRYNELLAKSLQKEMSQAEHEEFLGLISEAEAKSVERLKHLVELAELWNMSVDEVMKRLGITPPPVIHG
jgi:hypothetical protein